MKKYTPSREPNMRGIQALMISGQIEGHTVLPEGVKATKYEEIIPKILNLEENPSLMHR